MPDISMCADASCPSAATCRRSPLSGTDPNPLWQSWFDAARDPGAADCGDYWPTRLTPTQESHDGE